MSHQMHVCTQMKMLEEHICQFNALKHLNYAYNYPFCWHLLLLGLANTFCGWKTIATFIAYRHILAKTVCAQDWYVTPTFT